MRGGFRTLPNKEATKKQNAELSNVVKNLIRLIVVLSVVTADLSLMLDATLTTL